MPVPVNQSFVWCAGLADDDVQRDILGQTDGPAQEISITSVSIRVANFFMRYPPYIGQRPFVKFIINDTLKFVKNVLIFFHLLFILSFSSAFRPVFQSKSSKIINLFRIPAPRAPAPCEPARAPPGAPRPPSAPARSPCPPCRSSGSSPSPLRQIRAGMPISPIEIAMIGCVSASSACAQAAVSATTSRRFLGITAILHMSAPSAASFGKAARPFLPRPAFSQSRGRSRSPACPPRAPPAQSAKTPPRRCSAPHPARSRRAAPAPA